ncbi:hypothetical protein P171DRAFT_442316 [Karstenula rhodostoma CBS 690.94]|uniref:Nascent polypeptide-associated complex subunit alpha-like UBA domain-containing protein n=1 Tax=Karstenula rhodostoma CBS 690.94 TaxID=1392251 RepID=A0A9P4PMY1_9PLEO|nr:hypothetical protein P171DRAFT_442316 [Karstenula rhodostoma CBS 690.94]
MLPQARRHPILKAKDKWIRGSDRYIERLRQQEDLKIEEGNLKFQEGYSMAREVLGKLQQLLSNLLADAATQHPDTTPKDIELVMQNANVERETAITTLRENDNGYINAILALIPDW